MGAQKEEPVGHLLMDGVTVNIGGTWYAYDIDFAKFNAPSSIYYHTPYSVTSKSIHFQGVGVNLY